MFDPLLYHTNQIQDVQVNCIKHLSGKVVYHSTYSPKENLCPCCHHNDHSLKGKKIRKLLMAPLGNQRAYIHVEINRLKCLCCGHIWWPSLPFARPRKRVTLSFERYVVRLMNFATVEHTARFLGVSWALIKNIHKNYLRENYSTPDLNSINYIGVDEFSVSKGHVYMTIFINLESGEIIHAVEGKSMDDVKPFLSILREKAINLKAIAMDMNAAYASAAKIILPNVDVVFDRFHVVAMLNKVIDEIRRNQQAKCSEAGLRVLKGHRFLLLSNYEKLTPEKTNNLELLFEVNKPLAIAHTMKEQIRLFWSQLSREAGAGFLFDWVWDVSVSGIKELWRAGKTLLRRSQDLLNYFKHRITNGKTEGINNKIKTMKRQAYGFRDIEYFKLRLYNLHKTRYSFAR